MAALAFIIHCIPQFILLWEEPCLTVIIVDQVRLDWVTGRRFAKFVGYNNCCQFSQVSSEVQNLHGKYDLQPPTPRKIGS